MLQLYYVEKSRRVDSGIASSHTWTGGEEQVSVPESQVSLTCRGRMPRPGVCEETSLLTEGENVRYGHRYGLRLLSLPLTLHRELRGERREKERRREEGGEREEMPL